MDRPGELQECLLPCKGSKCCFAQMQNNLATFIPVFDLQIDDITKRINTSMMSVSYVPQ